MYATNSLKKAVAFVFLMLVSGCTGLEIIPLELNAQGNRLYIKGDIFTDSPDAMREALANNPGIDTLILVNVPGSVDDEANLEMARLVRAAGLTTIVPSDGMVASGGTDLFLAGKVRKVEPGACIGVHTWAMGGLFGYTAGADVPREDPQHRLYLDYYEEMEIDAGFYWFTLKAAPVASIYWMTNMDMNRFNLTTDNLPENKSRTQQDVQNACDQAFPE